MGKYLVFFWRSYQVSVLMLVDDDFEWATQCPGGAYGFTLSAPAALFRFDNSYNVVNHYQSSAVAHANTQATTIAQVSVYYRHLSHYY